MAKGFEVDPELVAHAARRAGEAVAHFETHGTAVKHTQSVIEGHFVLLGGYGDAGYFFDACTKFNTKFNQIFDTLISHNDKFVGTARQLHEGLQTASKLYVEADAAASERLQRIDEPRADGSR